MLAITWWILSFNWARVLKRLIFWDTPLKKHPGKYFRKTIIAIRVVCAVVPSYWNYMFLTSISSRFDRKRFCGNTSSGALSLFFMKVSQIHRLHRLSKESYSTEGQYSSSNNQHIHCYTGKSLSTFQNSGRSIYRPLEV